jgi:DNA-binding CsgD family transcriptional regulator
MDDRARLALEQLARHAVTPDLDQIANEVEMLRQELTALRAVSGLLTPSEVDRRTRVAELRAQGMSVRAIAWSLGCNRATVSADLRRLAVPRPSLITGLDGRRTRGPSPAGL